MGEFCTVMNEFDLCIIVQSTDSLSLAWPD